MNTKTYLQVSAVALVAWVLALWFIPPLARTVEQLLLLFLSSNA